jgi:predicted enzyme related to lactoylglutathione lyase
MPPGTWNWSAIPTAGPCPAPTEEDLLVLYLGQPADDKLVARLVGSGGQVVSARNHYWGRWGVTIADPDGYRLVLSHRTWP